MTKRFQLGVPLALCAAMAAVGVSMRAARVTGAAAPQQLEREIQAVSRQFPEIGPGVSALKRDGAGRYYILALPATVVAVYTADGKRIANIPGPNSGTTI